MVSERILGRLAWGVWIGFDWLMTGTGGGLFERGDEPSDSCATELVSYYQIAHIIELFVIQYCLAS
jgi:hypothetical protein